MSEEVSFKSSEEVTPIKSTEEARSLSTSRSGLDNRNRRINSPEEARSSRTSRRRYWNGDYLVLPFLFERKCQYPSYSLGLADLEGVLLLVEAK